MLEEGTSSMDSKNRVARLLLQEARSAIGNALASLRAETQRKETRLSLAVICASLGVIAFGAVLPFLWRESRTLAYGISLAMEWRWACFYCGGVSLLVGLAGHAISRGLRSSGASEGTRFEARYH
jgi:hypothetical protein